jgi:dTDP-4-amino-4,6-dideoxygalactose transaminase
MTEIRPVREQFLVFGRPSLGKGEIDEVVDSMESGWIGTGPKVKQFEAMLSDYVGVANVRCVSSCTAALMLALKTLGIGPGDEVIVPSMTFIASANAVEHVGATPVFVDSEPGTGLLDLGAAEAAITPRTRAIMPVHLAGRAVDMDALDAIRDRHGLLVVEDAAHAIGAEWKGIRIGGHGNLTAYSFYVTKNITTIEGGALATTDSEIAARVERLALHGLSLGAWQRFSDAGYRHYEVEEPGFKFNMTDVQAAVGLHQLPHLDEWIDERARLGSIRRAPRRPAARDAASARGGDATRAPPLPGARRSRRRRLTGRADDLAHASAHRGRRALSGVPPSSVLPGSVRPRTRALPSGDRPLQSHAEPATLTGSHRGRRPRRRRGARGRASR